MSGERHKLVFRLFEAACELPPERREEFLARECGGDAALRAEVEDLLSRDRGTMSLLDSPAVGTGVKPPGVGVGVGAGAHGAGAAPESIGHYRILATIGEGGFGVVYLAEQREPVRRRVALKVIKAGMDSAEVVARFEAERQALALMDHPHVAKVFDAGVTERGLPYFAMEHVPGVPITHYCDRARLTTAERLELFVVVCAAVQHAHTKGIIHRDLKPSNILVGLLDGKPVPKVIDFGVAKAVNTRLTERTIYTETGRLIGTPEYMAPEQAGTTGLDVDTRADIYSLGVLLYELISGTLPFDPRTLRAAGYAELERIIREVEAERPSTKLSRLSGAGPEGGAGEPAESGADKRPTAEAIALARRTDASALRRQIAGDLDWITLKALEKDRTRRYETANALAMDVRRHLADEPVLARPPSAGYRVGKFVRKHRLGVAAAGALLALLVAGVVGTSIGLVRATRAEREVRTQRDSAETARAAEAAQRIEAERQRDRALTAEERAKAEAERARQIARFLGEMLEGVGPSVALGRDTVLLREILDKTAARVAREVPDQPEVGAYLHGRLGRVYLELGQYGPALAMMEESLRLTKQWRGDEHGDVATALYALAAVRRSRSELAEAEALYRQCLEMRRRLLKPDDPMLATALGGLGLVLRERGDLAGAEEALREGLGILGRSGAPKDDDFARLADTLGGLRQARGDVAEAEHWLREAVEIRRRLAGDLSPDTVLTVTHLAALRFQTGERDEAEKLMREALELRRKLHGDEHPEVARSLSNLATVLAMRGDLAGAEPMYREALEMNRRLLGDEHVEVATCLNNLGYVIRSRGDLATAEPYYREALAIYRTRVGEEHPHTARQLNNLGSLVQDLGRLDEAEEFYGRALAIRRRLFGAVHPDIAQTINNMASLKRDRGDAGAAEPLYREAIDIYIGVYGQEHPDVALAMYNLAGTVEEKGEYEAALDLYRRTAEMRRRVLGEDHPDVADSLCGIARCLNRKGDYTGAQGPALEAVEIVRRRLGPEIIERAQCLVALGETMVGLQSGAEAEPPLREALRIYTARLPAGATSIIETSGTLALALILRASSGDGDSGARFAEAERLLLDGWGTLEANVRSPRHRREAALERLVLLYVRWERASPGAGKAEEAARWRERLGAGAGGPE